MLEVELEKDEQITGESGALTYMSPNIDIRTRTREKSLLGSLKTSLLGGQSLFVTDFAAMGGTGKVALVAAPIGDIIKLDITPEQGYIIQKSFVITVLVVVDAWGDALLLPWICPITQISC